jgi:hypothetical protein
VYFIKQFGSGALYTRVYLDNDWEEYVVQLYVKGVRKPEAAYHTPDEDDALGTAKIMAGL